MNNEEARGMQKSARHQIIDAQVAGCSSDLTNTLSLLREAKKWVSRCNCIGALDCERRINDHLSEMTRKGEGHEQGEA